MAATWSSLLVFLTTLLSLIPLSRSTSYIFVFEIWALRKTPISLTLFFDLVSLIFAASVLLISLSVIFFRHYYLSGIASYTQFHLTLATFILSIIVLIFRPNIIRIMIGWDGLGISSYLLVIFYKSVKSFNAGLLTGISNRVGDGLILISLGAFFSYPFLTTPIIGGARRFIRKEILLLIAVAAITKRAQIPFRAWLPAAMAAPTPVSALVHSSTLVTAGIYVLIRLFNRLPQELYIVLSWFGAITIILARFRALKETDGKKIIALSTLSQLGVIITGFRFNLPSLVFFHLLAHAFFKALLFISTGFVIHNFNNYQNLRLMGGRRKWISMNSRIIIASKLRLAGLPFFAGFYSKEALLETLRSGTTGMFITYRMMVVGVILTVLYSLRFLFARSYFTLRIRAGGYSSLKSNSLVVRRLILFTLRIVSGKKLFFILSPFAIIPILTFSRKLFITVLLLTGGWWYFFSRRAASRSLKFYRFMWGLPIFAGGLLLKRGKRAGIKLVKALGFSYLDHLIGPWTLHVRNYNRLMTTHRSSSIQKTLVLILMFSLSGLMLIY